MRRTPKPVFSQTDRRLLGVWRSDARATLAEWKGREKLRGKRRKFFDSIFGKLEIRYTHNRVVSRLPKKGWISSRSYAVVGTDETSVAIYVFGKLWMKPNSDPEMHKLIQTHFSKPELQHLHFDSPDRYWISLGKNREFFRKLRT